MGCREGMAAICFQSVSTVRCVCFPKDVHKSKTTSGFIDSAVPGDG